MLKSLVLSFINKLTRFQLESLDTDLINYLCGNEALPNPLETEAEREYLLKLKAGDESAKVVLIEHNLRLVVYIAKKFENTGLEQEDLISVGSIGLIKAVNTFDVDKNIKLATYASRCIENEILMYLRKSQKQKKEISLDKPLSFDSDGNELLLGDIIGVDAEEVFKNIETSVEHSILTATVNRLNAREREIVTLRFGLGGKDEMTQKEVADVLNISQSYISRIEKKILARMKKDIAKLM
ncbi:MAG: RNA polymerase sporulation sigma factor SigK [Firmicutes bacterium]|nr:RNA polymerase sporulation sigma factor SigK [Bacillota bacterium]